MLKCCLCERESGSQIFDYDYMNDIVNEEFLSILTTEEVQ